MTMRHLARGAATAAAALVLTIAPAAQAGTRTVTDPPGDVAAAYDLVATTFSYTRTQLAAVTTIRDVVRRGVVVQLTARHYGEGYVVRARTWWKDGAKQQRLFISYNVGSWQVVSCPGMSTRWRLGPRGTVAISVPNSCTFRGYPLDRFRMDTIRSHTLVDRTYSWPMMNPRGIDVSGGA
ncbi:hypothetical protein [Nocardioides ultimimeridianus]